MQKMTPNLDHLPLMNKVEVFEHSLEHTQGDDLAKILLLKAPSSEVWFDRRTNFTRSLAVMSMVRFFLLERTKQAQHIPDSFFLFYCFSDLGSKLSNVFFNKK